MPTRGGYFSEHGLEKDSHCRCFPEWQSSRGPLAPSVAVSLAVPVAEALAAGLVVGACLEKKPDARPTAAQLAAELTAIQASLAPMPLR